MADATAEAVFEKYNITESLTQDEKLQILEKEKEKLLRKLNHVFGNPQKEEELSGELRAIEHAMASLQQAGGKLSLDDVEIEMRDLSQTSVEIGSRAQEEAQEFLEKEAMLRENDDLSHAQKIELLYEILHYYLSLDYWAKIEQIALLGADLGDEMSMRILYLLYSKELISRVDTPQRALYWLRKSADAGNKDSCFDMGKYYLAKNSAQRNPQKAAVYFVKAADESHPLAYLHAWAAFASQKDYARAEVCLTAAVDAGISGAAYRLGLMYDDEDNQTGERDIEKARYWYETAYRNGEADGDVCYLLGLIYLEQEETEEGIELLKQGVEEFDSDDCREELEELEKLLKEE
jgi:TPR repeat protein